MHRVVITGLGLISCLGSSQAEIIEALREGRSGISEQPEWVALGLRSQIAGRPTVDLEQSVDRRLRRFMGDAAGYAWLALRDAIADAGLPPERISHPRTGLIAGSGGGSAQWQVEAADLMRQRGVRRVGPFMVPRTMCSTVSAGLGTAFHIRGISYSIASACATSAHCIGAAADLIRYGAQDVMFAGGGEELHWAMTCQFDAMGALSTGSNDRPTCASRPYDRDRDGFVIAGGAGMLVLESLQHARARGAVIHGELVGYGVASDGCDMVAPGGDGATRCMRMALAGLDRPVDYLNTHGTSTPQGDLAELAAVREVFGADPPPLSSTKALSGHALGAAGAHEAIYSLLMLREGFIAGSAHIDRLDPAAEGFPIVRASQDARLRTVMSNSFGFGGVNASLVFSAFSQG